MSVLSHLEQSVDKKAKRRGRGLGSGRGAKSGRGTTRHQKARESIPLHFEGGQGRLVKKFPLLRGKLRNKPVSAKKVIITLDTLQAIDTNEITVEQLIKAGIVSSDQKVPAVKVVATGTITKKMDVRLPVTQAAKIAIEKAGGTVQ